MKGAYTNKKIVEIQDRIMREVILLVETQVEQVRAFQLISYDDSSASTKLSWVRLNKMVEALISFNFQIINFINISVYFFKMFSGSSKKQRSFSRVDFQETYCPFSQMLYANPVIME